MRSMLSASRAFRIGMTSARVISGRSFFVLYIAVFPFLLLDEILSAQRSCSRLLPSPFADIHGRVLDVAAAWAVLERRQLAPAAPSTPAGHGGGASPPSG